MQDGYEAEHGHRHEYEYRVEGKSLLFAARL